LGSRSFSAYDTVQIATGSFSLSREKCWIALKE
jgi:hypothetical protein